MGDIEELAASYERKLIEVSAASFCILYRVLVIKEVPQFRVPDVHFPQGITSHLKLKGCVYIAFLENYLQHIKEQFNIVGQYSYSLSC